MSDHPLPSVAAVAKELAVVVHVGLRVSGLISRETTVATLLGLTCVRPPTGDLDTTDERARRFVRMLRSVLEEIKKNDTQLGDGLAVLFGASDMSSTVSPVERREHAAAALGFEFLSSENFLRRQQPKFCGLAADRLIAHEEESRLRETRNRMEVGAPADAAVAVDWLDRFQYYYRVWTPLSGLSADITAYLTRRKLDPATAKLESYAESSLWFFARFGLGVDRFTEERGGIWLLSDANLEQEVSDLVYQIAWHTPTSVYDSAWLANNVMGRDRPSMVNFRRALREEEVGRQLLARWTSWLAACTCSDPPDPDCEVHRVARFSERYLDLIDAEWYRIVGWYSSTPERPSTESIDIAGLFAKYPYDLSNPTAGAGELSE